MKTKKNLFVWLFATLCLMCSLLSFAFLGKKTQAVEASAATTSTFEMVGASVRTSEMDGIRFIAKIDSQEFASYGDAKKYGMILIPQDRYDGNDLTVTYTSGTYVASDTDALVIEGGTLWSEELRAEYAIDDGYEAFSCALIADQGDGSSSVRFPKEFYNRPLTAVAFIIPQSGTTIYTKNVTRSMAYVALVESLKPTYEGNLFIEDIVADASADLSVNGGKIDNTKTAYTPTLTLGGLDAKTSSLVSVSYASSKTAVAKIVNGKVQAVADGTATITATVTVGGEAKFKVTENLTVDILKATVTATSENTVKGTVTGGGTVEKGNSVTVTATANTGYTFDGWYEGSTKVSSSAIYTFTAGANKSLTAKFTLNSYTISVTSESTSKGTVTGGGTYDHFATAQVKATRKTGYNFDGWYEGSTKVSSSSTYSFEVTGARTLVAKWKVKNVTVTFNANGGSAVDSQTIQEGKTATAPTTSKTGYTFKHWSATDGGSTAYDFNTAITSNVTLYAVWTINSYTVTFNANNGSGGSTQTVNYNAKPTTPSEPTRTGYTFQGWGTSASATTTVDVTATAITANKTYYAVWKINTYTVTFNANSGSGGSTQTVNYNAKPTTPSNPTRTGYTFQGWGTSASATTTVDVTATAIKANKTYYAVWKINTYTVTLTAGTGVSAVSGNGTYDYNTSVTLGATVKTGYTWKNWTGSSTQTTKAYSFKITGDVSFTANATANTYAVKYFGNGSTSGSMSDSSHTYDEAKTLTANAFKRTGYTFQGWATSSSATTATYADKASVKNLTSTNGATVNLYAVWKVNSYTLTLTAGTGGSVTGGGTYDYGKSVTIKATPSTGYNFTKWSDGNTSASREITVTDNTTLTATFTAKKFTVSVSAATVGGTVSGGGSISYGSSTTLKATTNSGYTFLGWYDTSDKKVDSAPSYTFKVTGAVTLKAKWKAGALSSDEQTWKNKQGYNYWYYTKLGTDVMPIGAWSSPPPARKVNVNGVTTNYATNQTTVANYQTLKASGINAIYGLYDDYWSYNVPDAKPDGTHWDQMKASLDCAEATGMVYIVKDGGAYNALSKLGSGAWERLEAYMSHPAYGGTLFVDEPGYEQFDAIGSAMDEWYANEVYGDNKLALVNNLPIYSTQAQLYYGIQTTNPNGSAPTNYTGSNFESWVRAYIQKVDPSVYSFDFYPYLGYGNSMNSGYFENLSVVRKVCMEYNKPFWTFNQAGSAFGNTRELSYADTAMQVNLSLAYGAKGIQWFNYWQPLEFSADKEDINGLVDHYGNKTVYYNYVQKINKQIAAVDHILMKSKSTGIIPIGEAMYGVIPSRDIISKYGPVTSATGAGSAIVGCFEYRDQGYAYYIASTDANKDAVVTLNLNGTYSMEKIQDGATCWATGSKITVHVPAGEGVLVRVPKSTASETMRTLTLSNTDSAAGTLYGAGSYGSGKTITIAAVAKPGYEFVGWWSGSSIYTTAPVYSFTTTSNMTLTAYWRKNDAPLLLNNCETAGSWVMGEPQGSPNLSVTTSTSYATQGSKSVKISGLKSGLFYLRLGEKCMTLSELKSAYKVISFNIYSTSTSDQALWLGNWGAFTGSYVKPGYNLVRINTADLTSEYYSAGILKLTLPPVNAESPTTFYVDNVCALKEAALINDCESTDYIQAANTSLSTSNVYQGSYSLQVTNTTVWASINLRVGAAHCSLANFQAMYSKITFNIYSDYPNTADGNPALTLFLGNGEKPIAMLAQGNNVVTIDTSQLTASTLVSDAWGTYINFFFAGPVTLRLDNVWATLK